MIDLYNQGLYAEAFPLYLYLAGQGDAEAQYELGKIYNDGKGVAKDCIQMHYWYDKAGKQGNVKAIEAEIELIGEGCK